MAENSMRREDLRAQRAVVFLFVLAVLPAGAFALVAQHDIKGGVGVAAGLVVLWGWYAVRPWYASDRARRLGWVCSLLTVAVAALAAGGLVLLISTPAAGASPARADGELLCALAAILALGIRLITGARLRQQVTADAAAPPPRQEAAARPAGDPAGALVTTEPDGTVVLGTRRLRWRAELRGAAAATPLVLLLLLRLMLYGWVAALVTVAGVAIALGLALTAYEIRARHGAARVSGAQVSVRKGVWGQRSVPRGLIQRTVLVTARLGSPKTQYKTMLLLLGSDGHCLLRVDAGFGVSERALRDFGAALRVPFDAERGFLGPDDMSRQYPGALSRLALFHLS